LTYELFAFHSEFAFASFYFANMFGPPISMLSERGFYMCNFRNRRNAMAKDYVLVVGSNATRIETQGGGLGAHRQWFCYAVLEVRSSLRAPRPRPA
jgi:hypothetical protein